MRKSPLRPFAMSVCGLLIAQLSLAASFDVAQNSSKLIEIKVTGSERFPQDTLIAATGLKLGADGGDDSLKEAANRLASSGMFSDVTYRYVSSPQGTKAEFQVHDTTKLFPASFDNFVWLARDELIRRLKSKDPLFQGEIPNAGEMSQHVADSTKAVLQDLGVPADVKVFPQVPPEGGEITGFLYQVTGVRIPMRTIVFSGASPTMIAVLNKLAETSLLGNDYSEASVRSVARLDFLPQYQMRGFLRAAFATPAPLLQDRATGTVTVTLPVSEGLCYRLSSVQWSGNTVFSSAELEKAVKAQLGVAANQVALEEGLGGLATIYGTKGYMEAQLKPEYHFDDTAETVAVDVGVHEGDQYRMGQLQFLGITDSASAPLRKLWKLHGGDVYDSSYPTVFFASVGRQFDLSRFLVGVSHKLQRESKTVDVFIQLSAQ